MALMAHQLGDPGAGGPRLPPAGRAGPERRVGGHGDRGARLGGRTWTGGLGPASTRPPDRDKVPQTEVPQPAKPKPQVDPPPSPPGGSPTSGVADEDAADVDEEDESESGLLLLLLIAGAVVGGAALVSLPFLAILALKAARAARRRTRGTAADQVSGAWDEIVDRARDLGHQAPSTVTRREAAAGLQEAYPAVPLVPLAADIDAAVFRPGRTRRAPPRAPPGRRCRGRRRRSWPKFRGTGVSRRWYRYAHFEGDPFEAALARRRRPKETKERMKWTVRSGDRGSGGLGRRIAGRVINAAIGVASTRSCSCRWARLRPRATSGSPPGQQC